MSSNNKNSPFSVSSQTKKIPKKVKFQLKPLVQKVLNKCSNSTIISRKFKWEEIEDLYEALKEIQNIEKDYVIPLPNRNCDNCDEFYKWCTENGSKFKTIKIKEISDENYGIIAEDDIQENEQFLTVPRNMMMTEKTAAKSKLGPLISSDPILQHMPNVQLSLHLIMELLNSDSFWKPYISILPASYNTILYFTIEELKDLQGSPVLDDVIKIYRSVARQYCYFSQLFQNDAYARSLNIGQYFTYELYRWAVSTVMTRQNAIPSADGKSQAALIPFFDMCNHTNGKLTTDFSLEKEALVSYAFCQFLKGVEVKMFYGPRTNADFFVHNGFVYPENENDAVEIKLGISKSDQLYSVKSDMFAKLNIELNGTFKLRKRDIISEKLLLFLKINCMKADELEDILKCDMEEIYQKLESSLDLTKRALSFLKDRIHLLLKCYKTTVEEDVDKIFSNLSMNNSLVHQLVMSEKKILNQAFKYCVENCT